ncbi:hypothetical protein D9M70_524870 [compost metagenome]
MAVSSALPSNTSIPAPVILKSMSSSNSTRPVASSTTEVISSGILASIVVLPAWTMATSSSTAAEGTSRISAHSRLARFRLLNSRKKMARFIAVTLSSLSKVPPSGVRVFSTRRLLVSCAC